MIIIILLFLITISPLSWTAFEKITKENLLKVCQQLARLGCPEQKKFFNLLIDCNLKKMYWINNEEEKLVFNVAYQQV